MGSRRSKESKGNSVSITVIDIAIEIREQRWIKEERVWVVFGESDRAIERRDWKIEKEEWRSWRKEWRIKRKDWWNHW
jgi:hypothetical protein